jgi:hypothetical protein
LTPLGGAYTLPPFGGVPGQNKRNPGR